MTQPLSRPPDGSCFVVEQTPEGLYRIHWRTALPGCARFGAAAFLVFWLCGWAACECFAVAALASAFFGVGLVPVQGMNVPFLCVWLAGWTLGGVAAMFRLYLLLRPTRPESITLGLHDLVHDPGSGPLNAPPRRRRQPLPPVAPARRRTFTLPQLAALRLERIGDQQRLTVDCGADRVEIGPTLREPEREWLHGVLAAWAGR